MEILKGEASRTGGLVTVETLNAEHGWTFPDRWCYDQQAAELIWEISLRIFSGGCSNIDRFPMHSSRG